MATEAIVSFWEKSVKVWGESADAWERINKKYPGDSEIIKNKNYAQRQLDRCIAHVEVSKKLIENKG
jgi:hypothetical protein